MKKIRLSVIRGRTAYPGLAAFALSLTLLLAAGTCTVYAEVAGAFDKGTALPESYGRMDPAHIAKLQGWMKGKPVGRRIAAWAEMFVGTPYDPDPLGAYVRGETLVCDSQVDCMYLVFRAVELATSSTPEGAADRALDLRFITRGKVVGSRVVNYEERFAYAEDMIASGKWGEDVTAALGRAERIPGSRGRDFITYLPKEELMKAENMGRLKSGDMVFFVKDPGKRVVGEVIGHLGIIKVEGTAAYLIHGSGTKTAKDKPGGGAVAKVALSEYLRATRFIGVQVTRFPEDSSFPDCP